MGQTNFNKLYLLTYLALVYLVAPSASQTAYIVSSQQADFNPVNHTFNHLAYAVTDHTYDVILLASDYKVQVCRGGVSIRSAAKQSWTVLYAWHNHSQYPHSSSFGFVQYQAPMKEYYVIQ